MADPSRLSVPGTKVSQDLKLVSGMLQNMQESGQIPVPFSPGIPPVAFGAGGPMCVRQPAQGRRTDGPDSAG